MVYRESLKLQSRDRAVSFHDVTQQVKEIAAKSGMKNGIEWLGFFPLFHAAALWQTQGGNTLWVPIFLACAAFLLAWAIGQALMDEYDMLGVPDEVL